MAHQSPPFRKFSGELKMAEKRENRYWNQKIETMSRDEMSSLQLKKLKRQIFYNYENSSFYRNKFKKAGMVPNDIQSLEDFQYLPFMNKDEHRRSQQDSIDELGHPYGPGTITCASPEKIVRINATSGTTGSPTLYTLTQRDVKIVNELNARRFWMAGIGPGDIIIQGMALSMFVGGLPLSQGIMAVGACVVPVGVEGGSKRFLDFIQITAPTGIFATPSFGQYLIEQCPKVTGKDAGTLRIKRFFTAGEPGGGNPEMRKLLSEGFGGAKIFDHTGGGHAFAGATCEEPPEIYTGMHFMSSDYCLFELADPKTRRNIELDDGAVGELVLTSLDWEGGPLMRYAYGDIVRISNNTCDCGRTGLKFSIMGRADEMLIVKGVNVYPEAIKKEIVKFRQKVTGYFRILLDRPGPLVIPPLKIKIEYRKTVAGRALPDLEKKMLNEFKRNLRISPEFIWVPPNSIPREAKKTVLIEIQEKNG
jgi:phenylacetate-CoA ligase